MITTLGFANPSGWGWNTHLLTLPSGGLFVYNPAWLGDDTFTRIAEHGTPEVLFAPNHYHHLALEKYRDKWPAAFACASKPALSRLLKLGHPGLHDAAEAPLPAGARLLISEGTKSGETFLAVDGEWIVGDAFANFTTPITGFTGLILRQLHVGELDVGNIFKWFVVKDAARYCAWLAEQLDRDQPKTIHFCHGAPLSGPDIADKLKSAARARLT